MTAFKKEAVLKIWYTCNGIKTVKPQGKFFYLEGKPVFIADDRQLWTKFNGYSISKQILEAFTKSKIRPQIIYRFKHMSQLYYAKPSTFKSKGILVSFGGHEQYILPKTHFDAKHATIHDPHGLSEMSVSDWIKTEAKPIMPCNTTDNKEINHEVYVSSFTRLAYMARGLKSALQRPII